LAARGARAAGGQAADHRISGREHAFSVEPMDRRLCFLVSPEAAPAISKAGLKPLSEP
jgi:hypothetical protein